MAEPWGKRTIKDIEVQGKVILMRADFNVPIVDGVISSDFRIKQTIPTIQYLLERGCSVVLLTHLGRPEGKRDERFSLRPVAERLGQLLGKQIKFVNDCLGSEAEQVCSSQQPGDVILLENVRFYAAEEENDQNFAQKLATYGEIFVQDAFGVVHHGAVSVSELPKIMPSAAGLLLEKEVTTLERIMSAPMRPLTVVIGGAKIADKIAVLRRFIDIADAVLIGGAMANTFLYVLGKNVGGSLVDKDDTILAKEILERAKQKAESGSFLLFLPFDAVVSDSLKTPSYVRIVDFETHSIAALTSYPKVPPKESAEVQPGEGIYDIGPSSASFMAGVIQLSKSVIWNGTLGVTETKGIQAEGPFEHGTKLVTDAMLGHFGHKPFVVVGGGDTTSYLESLGLTNAFGHVSTGGGASLELMEGKTLPGIAGLSNR